MGKRHRLPPDEVGNWHQAGVSYGYDKMRDMDKWLDKHCELDYYVNSMGSTYRVSFLSESDWMMFMLTYSGERGD